MRGYTIDMPREEIRDSKIKQWVEERRTHPTHLSHYYGDVVRKLFLGSGVLMLVGLPFFADNLELTVFSATLGILIIGIFAGLTSPREQWVFIFDVCVSALASIVFELTAIGWYRSHMIFDAYFIFNQVLALVFFTALYFSVKTFRSMVLEGRDRNIDVS